MYLCRLCWFCGVKGDFESFNQGKERAKLAAECLIDEAKKHNKVMLFGHGVSIYFIRKELQKRGWLLQQKSNEYWGMSQLTKEG